MSLTIPEVAADLFRKLDIAAPGTAEVRGELAAAINWALQTMHQAGERFYGRKTISLTVSAGASSADFAEAVQTVLGPVRLPDGTPLRALASRGEFDAYGPLFLGEPTYSVPAGVPAAYLVERIDSGSGKNDRLTLRLCVVPAPSIGTILSVDGVEEIERITAAELVSLPGPADPVIGVPNSWSETVFLPLARYALTRSNYFSRAELRAELEKDYAQAMRLLGMATTQANENENR